MRHLIAFPVIAAALAMGGCAINGAPSTSVTPAVASAFITEVQQYASEACAFEPTAATIAQIATASSLSASATEALAQGIAGKVCASITAKSARRGGSAKPHVGRVTVHGRFESGDKI